MLFHAGALWRLNELGYLPKLDRVSSVSGGSITAGVLGMLWDQIGAAGNAPAPGFSSVIQTIRRMASETIDIGSILGGLFGPGTIAQKVAEAYDQHLFQSRTLQDLPDKPRFVINATSVQSTVLFRFSKPYAADWRVGRVDNPKIPLAVAVAASSAFPPLLSPLTLRFADYDLTVLDMDGTNLHREPYTTAAVLTDGGVYDNLGLETAWKRCQTILVSDGGGQVESDEDPHRDWARHSIRIANVLDRQVRSLRKRQCIAAFKRGRPGAYWGIRTKIANYQLSDALPCPPEDTQRLADIKTGLSSLPDAQQEALINWGYAVCDGGMRRHLGAHGPPPKFPYPRGCQF